MFILLFLSFSLDSYNQQDVYNHIFRGLQVEETEKVIMLCHSCDFTSRQSWETKIKQNTKKKKKKKKKKKEEEREKEKEKKKEREKEKKEKEREKEKKEKEKEKEKNKQEGKEKDPEQICTERWEILLWNLLDGSENKKLACVIGKQGESSLEMLKSINITQLGNGTAL
ncbi:hypothetical protein llap_3295 [Limosa lapponica baueri]|uniref:Uncharacterized protein n=1 Tax=Limosa lapponica baueri TaxID=1758121 RepID=A0A2I0UK24_LIMLA|nr:hypothetical protein llap_3295 [Limosa lapponica baueri]